MVAQYLRGKGYIIAAQNFSCNYGEIDIIAESRDTVMFVEVKTRAENYLVAPADTVDYAKQMKIANTARVFLSRARLKMKYRFDIAEVVYRKDENGKYRFSLNYITDAFYADLGIG